MALCNLYVKQDSVDLGDALKLATGPNVRAVGYEHCFEAILATLYRPLLDVMTTVS